MLLINVFLADDVEQRVENVADGISGPLLADQVVVLQLLLLASALDKVILKNSHAHLQQRPVDDDGEGHDVYADAPVHNPVLVQNRHPLNPGFARGDAEEGDNGARKRAKVLQFSAPPRCQCAVEFVSLVASMPNSEGGQWQTSETSGERK